MVFSNFLGVLVLLGKLGRLVNLSTTLSPFSFFLSRLSAFRFQLSAAHSPFVGFWTRHLAPFGNQFWQHTCVLWCRLAPQTTSLIGQDSYRASCQWYDKAWWGYCKIPRQSIYLHKPSSREACCVACKRRASCYSVGACFASALLVVILLFVPYRYVKVAQSVTFLWKQHQHQNLVRAGRWRDGLLLGLQIYGFCGVKTRKHDRNGTNVL